MKAELVEYDHLITVKKVEDHMNFDEVLNKNSKLVTHAICDGGIKSLKVNDVLQFERRGYFIVNEVKDE